jgi:hypothetical protein
MENVPRNQHAKGRDVHNVHFQDSVSSTIPLKQEKEASSAFKYECIRGYNRVSIEVPILWTKKFEYTEVMEVAQMIKECEQTHPYKK